jgi:N-acetylneuraminate synthase
LHTSLFDFINDSASIPLVIAELGINHQGAEDIALKLIEGASAAGVQAVKFQYRNLDKSYNIDANEIGDESLKSEIKRNYLHPDQILNLTRTAKKMGLWVGISFFILDDCHDFEGELDVFDFFKIPSVELLNYELIEFLAKSDRPLLISTGAHWEVEIEEALSRISTDNWFPLHCVSNYPVAPHNSNLSYIGHLKERWGRPVGFSSHESDWEYLLLALRYAPRIIERHLTIDRGMPGLDQTTSSTVEEFGKLVRILKGAKNMPSESFVGRVPNQGELLNRQNLGRSLYFSTKQGKGELLDEEAMVYRSPQIGITPTELHKMQSRTLKQDVHAGAPLLKSHFDDGIKLTDDEVEFANRTQIALPARLHDFKKVQREIPLKSLELHLSYSEIEKLQDFRASFRGTSLSLHLPDYVSPLDLIDPFSPKPEIRLRSEEIIQKVCSFVSGVQNETGKQVLVVGSFPVNCHESTKVYYERYSQLQSSLLEKDICLTMQWLPPFAWYFGGSERIQVCNSIEDAYLMRDNQISVCMDISHLILGSNFFKFDILEVLQLLSSNIKFYHLSDAQGLDGEGLQFDLSDEFKSKLFRDILGLDKRKTIEVWQGHFDNCEGFKRAIRDLHSLALGVN